MVSFRLPYSYRDQTLHCEKASLQVIADVVGTPFYCYSRNTVINRFNAYQQGLGSLDAQICFAVKSNSNLEIIRQLMSLGSGFDLVSGGELFRVLKAAKSAPKALRDGLHHKLVFSGVGKSIGEMRAALQVPNGLFSFNIESIPELLTLAGVAKSLKKTARIALRINPNVSAKTHPYISTGLKENKFGLTMKEALWAVDALEVMPHLRLVGLSIHIGSQMLSLTPLNEAFRKFSVFAAKVESCLLGSARTALEFLDLGGGLGVPDNLYALHLQAKSQLKSKERRLPDQLIRDYGRLIVHHFGSASRWGGKKKILIEPGRSLIAQSGALISSVLYRKPRAHKDFLILDAGMNDLIRPALYKSYHEVLPVHRPTVASKKWAPLDIVGPVCESGDTFGLNRLLPAGLEQGDLVAMMDCGAYGASMSSCYNSRPLVPEVLVDGNKFKIIRERESYEDLVRAELVSNPWKSITVK